MKKINPDNIIIIDNVFPEWFQTFLEKASKEVPWNFYTIKSMHKDTTESFLTNMVYELGPVKYTDNLNIIKPFNDALTIDVIPRCVPGAKIKQLTRLRWNGSLRDYELGPHIDYRDSTHWVFVYYVNDSDGDTIFYDADRVTEIRRCEYRKGRAVIFPADIYHKATAPKDSPLRISLGAIYAMSVN